MKSSNTSERLKDIMVERNLRQTDILKRCEAYYDALGVKIQKSDLSQYISGKVEPKQDKLSVLASALNVSEAWLAGYEVPQDNSQAPESPRPKMVKIPVLGDVAAGVPIDAIEDIIGYEEIPEQWTHCGEYFALRIKGDSMFPNIQNGDIVIVKSQPVADNNDIVIATVNGDTATCKRLKRYETELCLVSINPEYETMRFSTQEVESLPVTILGKVVELRRKFI